jgi:adenine-specific DNA-methyltransferase
MAYRYLGNKARIANWIADHVADKLPIGSRIADPMCGTATVSAVFAEHGFRVIAADELRFPVLHAQARLLHDGASAFGSLAAYREALADLNGLRPQKGFFWREYSDEGSPQNGTKPRKYFTGSNAAKIDAVRAEIKKWRQQGLASHAVDLLLHDLILAVNRVANIAGTYGYYRSAWNRASLEPLVLYMSAPLPHNRSHEVRQGRVEDLASLIDADAFYLDPPYTKRQYGGNYHILETIAQEDEPEPVGDGGLRDWYPQASDFCYRRKAKAAFARTLSQIKARWVFISYSEDGHLASPELSELLASFGTVERLQTPIERFRSNDRVAKLGAVHEHLYILEMSHARPT